MEFILSLLIAIASVLLILVVLVQKSKGGGLAANVNNYNQFMGVSKTTDFVEKATWGLAIFICVLSIASCIITKKSSAADANKPQYENVQTPDAQQNQGTPFTTGDAAQ